MLMFAPTSLWTRELLPVLNRNEISREAKSVDSLRTRNGSCINTVSKWWQNYKYQSVEMQTLSRCLRLHICKRDLWGLGSLKVVVLQVRVSCPVRNHFRRSGRYISLVSQLVQTYHHDDHHHFYSSDIQPKNYMFYGTDPSTEILMSSSATT